MYHAWSKVETMQSRRVYKSIKKGRSLYITHGAEKKRCSFEECNNYAQKGGVCVTHGATRERKRCSFEGCNNIALKRGVCWTHGAKEELKRCSVEGCTNHIVKGGVCITHGAKRK